MHHLKNVFMPITDKQIDIMLKGIEDGYTIDECCTKLLKFSCSSSFYTKATKEQKDMVIIHKHLHSSLDTCYARLRKK